MLTQVSASTEQRSQRDDVRSDSSPTEARLADATAASSTKTRADSSVPQPHQVVFLLICDISFVEKSTYTNGLFSIAIYWGGELIPSVCFFATRSAQFGPPLARCFASLQLSCSSCRNCLTTKMHICPPFPSTG
jgi:hypothetical protein